MGVGKSVQALAISITFKEDWPLLIICPSSLRFVWREEIWKWLPEIHKTSINLVKDGKDKLTKGSKIHIMSYEMATKWAQ